jgi:hypothetical protein
MSKESALYNEMLSNLSTALFRTTLESRCKRFGVELIRVNPDFDSAPIGDLQTNLEIVKLIGTRENNLTVTLQPTGVEITANSLGEFFFANQSLILGSNVFTVSATDLAGNQGTFSQTIERLPLQVNQAPTALNLTSDSIPENSGNNALIGTFTTTDPDVGDTHSYSLVSGNGDIDNNAFEIIGHELVRVRLF